MGHCEDGALGRGEDDIEDGGEDDCGKVGGVEGSDEWESCSGGGHEDGGMIIFKLLGIFIYRLTSLKV